MTYFTIPSVQFFFLQSGLIYFQKYMKVKFYFKPSLTVYMMNRCIVPLFSTCIYMYVKNFITSRLMICFSMRNLKFQLNE